MTGWRAEGDSDPGALATQVASYDEHEGGGGAYLVSRKLGVGTVVLPLGGFVHRIPFVRRILSHLMLGRGQERLFLRDQHLALFRTSLEQFRHAFFGGRRSPKRNTSSPSPRRQWRWIADGHCGLWPIARLDLGEAHRSDLPRVCRLDHTTRSTSGMHASSNRHP